MNTEISKRANELSQKIEDLKCHIERAEKLTDAEMVYIGNVRLYPNLLPFNIKTTLYAYIVVARQKLANLEVEFDNLV